MTGTSTEAIGFRDVRPAAESLTSATFGKTPRELSGQRVQTQVTVSVLPPLPGNPERRTPRRKEGGTTPGRDSACRPLWRQALFCLRYDDDRYGKEGRMPIINNAGAVTTVCDPFSITTNRS
jgi:hypothetical protein